ncbi:hypothetical protein [Tumebacillus permanentifrigoris]|uniref:Uncharacterized protein n=1 Tax=Tumebacillus permanentifrigoris TaxID=378543 RepID=A0A316DGB7_9BACL|nr:hypothetical protein [Tumebacillus permanentifrigoris]PWK15613.1 hypothetical protein C7459_103153 [Tumebacillus permanentifrigoris]
MSVGTLVQGQDLIRLRHEALSKRFDASSGSKIINLYRDLLGETDMKRMSLKDASDLCLKQALLLGSDVVQQFFYAMEGKTAKRLALFQIDRSKISAFAREHFPQAFNDVGLGDFYNNFTLREVGESPSIIGFTRRDGYLEVRWAQLRKTRNDDHTENYYYYSVASKIFLATRICYMLFDSIRRGDVESSWRLSVMPEYKDKLVEFLKCEVDDVMKFPLGWALQEKLIKSMELSATMDKYPQIFNSPEENKITGAKFEKKQPKFKRIHPTDDDGTFTEAETHLIVECLEDHDYQLVQISYIKQLGDEYAHLEVFLEGEIQIRKGLMMEGEIDDVVRELLQRSSVVSRPTYKPHPDTGQLQANI